MLGNSVRVWPMLTLKIVCAAMMIGVFGWFEHARGVEAGADSVMAVMTEMTTEAGHEGADVEGFRFRKVP